MYENTITKLRKSLAKKLNIVESGSTVGRPTSCFQGSSNHVSDTQEGGSDLDSPPCLAIVCHHYSGTPNSLEYRVCGKSISTRSRWNFDVHDLYT